MILKILVIFGVFLQLSSVSPRGIHSEKDQFYVNDFAEPQNGKGIEVPNLLLEKAKSGKEGKVAVDSTRHPVDQENIGSDKRRKFLNGRNNHFQTMNVTVEYVPGQENETWNVEKKEKSMDATKEVLKSQPAHCQFTTELVAAAQAAVTRALKGLCNSKEMEERFEDLESSITNQLNVIKKMILDLEDRLGEHTDAVFYGQKQLTAAVSKGCGGPSSANGGIQNSHSDLTNKNLKSSHEYLGPKLTTSLSGVRGEDPREEEEEEEEEVSGTRDPEIIKFNSSIHTESSLNGSPRKVFTYYWKIKDMMYKLTGVNPRKSFRSQSFYIFPGGYRMYMRIFPRQNENNFYVRVGLTKGEFDENLKWPFPLKHKIHILDQTKEGRLFEDIASRIWDPNLLCSDFNWQKPIKGDNHECVEVGFPHDVLKQREYIRENSLVIKLTVYLES